MTLEDIESGGRAVRPAPIGADKAPAVLPADQVPAAP